MQDETGKSPGVRDRLGKSRGFDEKSGKGQANVLLLENALVKLLSTFIRLVIK